MRKRALSGLVVVLAGAVIASGAKAPFTVDALLKLSRIDDPQVSPDGKNVAFVVQTVDVPANAKPSAVYSVPVDGGTPVRLTAPGSSNYRPRWSPDSKRILFISDRKDGQQVWSMNADGSDQKQVTSLPTGAEGEVASPDGKLILFTSDVYPECAAANPVPGIAYDTACNRTNLDTEAAAKMKARVYTSLLYRHWTTYQGKRRQHLLLQTLDTNVVRDLTPGML